MAGPLDSQENLRSLAASPYHLSIVTGFSGLYS